MQRKDAMRIRGIRHREQCIRGVVNREGRVAEWRFPRHTCTIGHTAISVSAQCDNMGQLISSNRNPREPPPAPPADIESLNMQIEKGPWGQKRRRSATGTTGPPPKSKGWSWRRHREDTQADDEGREHHRPKY